MKKLFFYIPALLLLVSALLPENKKVLLPYKGEPAYKLKPYIDYLDTTKGSMGTITASDSLIRFDYTLRTVNNNEAIKPISGFMVMFDVHSQGSFLDVKKYDYLDIDFTMKEAPSFMMYVKTFEHFTDTTNWVTQRFTEKEIELTPRNTKYRILFKEFSTPNWWKSLIGSKVLTLPKEPDYSKVMAIDFQNNPGGALDVPERMEIRRMEFRQDRRLFYGATLGGGLLWVLVVSAVLVIRKSKRAPRADEKPITHLSLPNQSHEQLERLLKFIGSSFQTAELSVEMVSRETGISQPKISALLQQKYSMNFKQYLNDVRITESKKHLAESDRSVAEIAFAVGYNSIPHFNRVFRLLNEVTPTEYREKQRGLHAG